MSHLFTRIASLVLAFGLFISCSTLLPNKSKSHNSNKDLSETQIQKQLDSLDQQISSGNDSPDLYYQKGRLLIELAQKKNDPSDRTSIYKNAQNTFHKALNEYPDTTGSRAEKIQQLLKVNWSNEHNQGVQIMQNDSTLENSDYETAAAHFRNATSIIPDSSISYKMEARAYYNDQQLDKAIAVLQDARTNIQPVSNQLLEQLAYLYSETDQPHKAIEVYRQMNPVSDQNLNIIHGLTNAYIAAGEHQNAIHLLQKLIQQEPSNIIYQQTLATEYYSLANQKLDTVATELKNGSKLKTTNFQSADTLISSAEQVFKKLAKENPENLTIKQRFAAFYQNAATDYQQLLPLAEELQKKDLEKKITQYLSSSIPLLKKVTEENPDEKSAWKDLYQAYTYLGRKEEAQNAKSNF